MKWTVARFVLLDAYCIRPYLRSLAITFVFVVGIMVAAGIEPILALTMVLMLGAILVPSYLYSLEERAGLDALYGLLPLRRRDVVVGRYLSLLLGLVTGLAIGIALALVLAQVSGSPADEVWLVAAGVSGVALVVLAVQAPLYFRFGYMRSRFAGYAVLLAFTALPALLATWAGVDPTALVEDVSPWLLALGLLVVASSAYAASLVISLRWYTERDF